MPCLSARVGEGREAAEPRPESRFVEAKALRRPVSSLSGKGRVRWGEGGWATVVAPCEYSRRDVWSAGNEQDALLAVKKSNLFTVNMDMGGLGLRYTG